MKLQEIVSEYVGVSFVHFLDAYEVYTDFGFFIESSYEEKEEGRSVYLRYLREVACHLAEIVTKHLPLHTDCEVYLRCTRGQDRQSNMNVFIVHCFFAYITKELNT
jgi:hypothetical protein